MYPKRVCELRYNGCWIYKIMARIDIASLHNDFGQSIEPFGCGSNICATYYLICSAVSEVYFANPLPEVSPGVR